jgi:hypothetical protein
LFTSRGGSFGFSAICAEPTWKATGIAANKMFGFTTVHGVNPVNAYSIEYQTFRDAKASPLLFGINEKVDELLEKTLCPPWRICQECLTGLNLIWAGKVNSFVLMVSTLAEELAINFVPTSIFLDGLRTILGICGLNDLSAE